MTESYYEPVEAKAPGLMQRAAAILPATRYARYVPKSPFLIGAALLGVAGVLAWRNREKIKATAAPMLQNAAEKTAELRERLPELRERLPWARTTAAPTTLQDNLH